VTDKMRKKTSVDKTSTKKGV